jgi:hypothetical protein
MDVDAPPDANALAKMVQMLMGKVEALEIAYSNMCKENVELRNLIQGQGHGLKKLIEVSSSTMLSKFGELSAEILSRTTAPPPTPPAPPAVQSFSNVVRNSGTSEQTNSPTSQTHGTTPAPPTTHANPPPTRTTPPPTHTNPPSTHVNKKTMRLTTPGKPFSAFPMEAINKVPDLLAHMHFTAQHIAEILSHPNSVSVQQGAILLSLPVQYSQAMPREVSCNGTTWRIRPHLPSEDFKNRTALWAAHSERLKAEVSAGRRLHYANKHTQVCLADGTTLTTPAPAPGTGTGTAPDPAPAPVPEPKST